MFVVGITGGIGSGKSAVTDHLETLGITVVDADKVARVVVEPGTPGLAAIAGHLVQTYCLPTAVSTVPRCEKLFSTTPTSEKYWKALLTRASATRSQDSSVKRTLPT